MAIMAIPIICSIIYYLNFKNIFNSTIGISSIKKNKTIILISIVVLIVLGLWNFVGSIQNIIRLQKIGFNISLITIITLIIKILYPIILIEILLKILKGNKNIKLNNINLQDFNCLKVFEEKININRIIEKKELKLDRFNFKNYQPKLIHKIVEKDNTLLEYSNQEDISVLIFIKNEKEIYTNF